jgi:aspartokinase/homoserine dehydrogenase 1
MDVARKVLILAREAGVALEFDQIKVTPMLPAEASAWSLGEFMDNLHSLDHHFEQLLEEAENDRKRIYFGAFIDCESGSAEIGMRSVALDHPFCALRGADNLVAFSTRRYCKQPLVVKGPGAGAEVTAAGVFSDIIRVAR